MRQPKHVLGECNKSPGGSPSLILYPSPFILFLLCLKERWGVGGKPRVIMSWKLVPGKYMLKRTKACMHGRHFSSGGGEQDNRETHRNGHDVAATVPPRSTTVVVYQVLRIENTHAWKTTPSSSQGERTQRHRAITIPLNIFLRDRICNPRGPPQVATTSVTFSAARSTSE